MGGLIAGLPRIVGLIAGTGARGLAGISARGLASHVGDAALNTALYSGMQAGADFLFKDRKGQTTFADDPDQIRRANYGQPPMGWQRWA